MCEICLGVEDKGPHKNIDCGENDCPFCRIEELEAEVKRLRDGIQSIHELLFVSHNEPNEDLANNE